VASDGYAPIPAVRENAIGAAGVDPEATFGAALADRRIGDQADIRTEPESFFPRAEKSLTLKRLRKNSCDSTRQGAQMRQQLRVLAMAGLWSVRIAATADTVGHGKNPTGF